MNIMPDFSGLGFPISKFQMLYMASFIFAGIVIILSFYKPGIVLCKDISKKSSCKSISSSNSM